MADIHLWVDELKSLPVIWLILLRELIQFEGARHLQVPQYGMPKVERKVDIATIDTSPVSLMPPGLTASLRQDELADLLAYLTSLGRRE